MLSGYRSPEVVGASAKGSSSGSTSIDRSVETMGGEGLRMARHPRALLTHRHTASPEGGAGAGGTGSGGGELLWGYLLGAGIACFLPVSVWECCLVLRCGEWREMARHER